MTYQEAILYLLNNADNDIHSWDKLVAIQIVGIRTADEIKRKAHVQHIPAR